MTTRARRLLAERLTAQLLAGPPARDPLAVTQRLLAIQAQDPRGARLAIRARTTGHTAADVDRALADRELLITTLNRGTLHLVRRDDYPWLHALTAPTVVTPNQTRLHQEGVSPGDQKRALKTIERALAADGPLTRSQLRERLDRAGVPTAGQALAHLIMLSALTGLTIRGPMAGREHAFVLTRDWLGPSAQTPPDRAAALAELARRFLAGHGPAGDRDLARWAGLPLRDVRAGLGAIAPELTERPDGLLDLGTRTRETTPARLPPPRLLGSFEPLLMGWVSREPVLGIHRRLVTANGIFHPFVFVDGRTVGTWRYKDKQARLELSETISARDTRALARDAADVERFLQ